MLPIWCMCATSFDHLNITVEITGLFIHCPPPPHQYHHHHKLRWTSTSTLGLLTHCPFRWRYRRFEGVELSYPPKPRYLLISLWCGNQRNVQCHVNLQQKLPARLLETHYNWPISCPTGVEKAPNPKNAISVFTAQRLEPCQDTTSCDLENAQLEFEVLGPLSHRMYNFLFRGAGQNLKSRVHVHPIHRFRISGRWVEAEIYKSSGLASPWGSMYMWRGWRVRN